MASDFSKAPEAILVDLVNEDNPGVGLTTSLVTFGNPSAPGGESPARNTQVTMSAVPTTSGYSGSVDLLYNRVDMAEIPGAADIVFAAGNAVNVSDLIPEINARYGINLTSADYVDAALPEFTDPPEPNENLPFDVDAAANSLIWFGSVTLTVTANDIPLNEAITVTTLNGLVYEGPY